MKVLKLIRAVEWWDYKFPPILVGVYLVFAQTGASLSVAIPLLLFIILSLAAGAVYVSVVNDATDVHDDHLAGKHNRLASYRKTVRVAVVLASLLLAAGFAWYMREDKLSLVLYISCYIAFTLYSVPPFRFKKRGLAGIGADAAGSQLLPTLYAASISAFYLHNEWPVPDLLLLAVWSFCFGLRGILWHQFHDLANDVRSGLVTWVQKLDERQTRMLGYSIIVPEIAALIILLWRAGQYAGFVGLGLYALYLLLHRRKNKTEIIMIKYHQPNYHIVMNEYYQVFLPAALLVGLALHENSLVVLLVLHVLVFPMGFYRVLKHMGVRR